MGQKAMEKWFTRMSLNMQTNQFARSSAHGRAFCPEKLIAWLVAPLLSAFGRASALARTPFRHGVSLGIVAISFLSPLSSRADAPVLLPPANTTVLEDCGRTNLTFTVTDADTPFFAVTVTASSSNTSLVASTNVAVVGSGT